MNLSGATAFILGFAGALFFMQLLAAANRDMAYEPAPFDEPVRPTVH
jgi:hypothetical protein